MKKLIYSLIEIGLLAGLVFFQAPQKVVATGIGEGTWVLPGAAVSTKYSTVNVDEESLQAPTWVQRFSDGIKISEPTKICYSFRPGQFGWVPKFMQYKNDQWYSMASTLEYIWGIEGGLYACASPKTAGIFTLFGFFNGPKPVSNQQVGKLFTVNNWNMECVMQSLSTLTRINWNGYYPEAIKLEWGIKICNIESNCSYWDYGSLSINQSLYPHPQTLTRDFSANVLLTGPDGDGLCEFKPYVRLLDSGSNELDVVFMDTEYSADCIS